jgi:threonine/homoserine/homoserine lactone efflux protein
MSVYTFLLFVGASSMIAIVPGPNVLLVVTRASAYGFKGATPVVLGLSSAASLYLAATVVGLTAMMARFPTALTVLRVLGAFYLAYMGLRMMWSSLSKASTSISAPPQSSRSSLFAQGFWTCFSNPKALLYWSAFLPQFIGTGHGVALQMILLGLTGIVLELIVLGVYAALASAASRMVKSSSKLRALQLLAGAILVALGASLGWSSIGARRVAWQ